MKITWILFILIVSYIFIFSFTKSSNVGNDYVIKVNAYNFNEYVYNQRTITLVNFYLNWCPHCIAFSSIWRQFSEDINAWKSVVRVAAFDCGADAINGQLCSRHGITRFPRNRVFPMNSQNHDLGQHFESPEYVVSLRTHLIDWILKSVQSSDLNLNLFPISIASKEELFNAFPIQLEKPNLIFLEKYPTHLGVEIVLDFSSYREYINIIRVYDRSGGLADQLFPHSLRLPALIQMHRNQSFELIASAHSDNEQLLRQAFGDKIKSNLNIDTNDNIIITDDVKMVNKSVTPRTPLPLSLADLYNTLRYSLHKEVTRFQTLNSTQVSVLKKYFSVVYKYFPFDNENVRRFFKRMKHWFANKTKEIKIDNFKAAMKISDGYLPPIVQWRHCSASKSHFRGYPCGLWSMFHVMTVKEYSMNSTHNSHEVLDLMRDFVIHFFSCEHCAKHFEKTSRRLSSVLTTAESSVLWLWRVHNQVNHRTKGSESEDPFFPKIQYPSHQMCSQCYQQNNEFNETNVLDFLHKTYSQKFLTKSADYFAEQKILNKNSVNLLAVNPFVFSLLFAIILNNL